MTKTTIAHKAITRLWRSNPPSVAISFAYWNAVKVLTIYMMVTRSSRLGHPVAAGVSCFQLVLAFYLTFVVT